MKIEVNNDKILSLIFFSKSGNFEILLNNMIKDFKNCYLENQANVYNYFITEKIIFSVMIKFIYKGCLIKHIVSKNILIIFTT